MPLGSRQLLTGQARFKNFERKFLISRMIQDFVGPLKEKIQAKIFSFQARLFSFLVHQATSRFSHPPFLYTRMLIIANKICLDLAKRFTLYIIA